MAHRMAVLKDTSFWHIFQKTQHLVLGRFSFKPLARPTLLNLSSFASLAAPLTRFTNSAQKASPRAASAACHRLCHSSSRPLDRVNRAMHCGAGSLAKRRRGRTTVRSVTRPGARRMGEQLLSLPHLWYMEPWRSLSPLQRTRTAQGSGYQ